MKIRNGFVSNSSSSSFVIVGTTFKKTMENCEKLCKENLNLTEDEIDSFTEKMCCGKKLKNKFCPECGKKNEEVEKTINWIDIFDEYRYGIVGIDIQEDENDGTLIIGKSLSMDMEGCSVDIDKFIKTLQDAKAEVEKLNIGEVKFHCGVSYN